MNVRCLVAPFVEELTVSKVLKKEQTRRAIWETESPFLFLLKLVLIGNETLLRTINIQELAAVRMKVLAVTVQVKSITAEKVCQIFKRECLVHSLSMVHVAQSVRVHDCESCGCQFESGRTPHKCKFEVRLPCYNNSVIQVLRGSV